MNNSSSLSAKIFSELGTMRPGQYSRQQINHFRLYKTNTLLCISKYRIIFITNKSKSICFITKEGKNNKKKPCANLLLMVSFFFVHLLECVQKYYISRFLFEKFNWRSRLLNQKMFIWLTKNWNSISSVIIGQWSYPFFNISEKI